jgi:cytochrome c1
MRKRHTAILGAGTLVVVVGALVTNVVETRAREERLAAAVTGGAPGAGKVAIMRRACGACHIIPGVPGARGGVGPPLTGFARRTYIAGRLVNTPDNLTAWIFDPQAVDAATAMPPTGVGRAEARDICAYLYTLK